MANELNRSAELFARAQHSIPGGASRSTVLVEPHPVYVAEGEGAWITDVDGNRYLDANNNFTSIIMGHADPVIDQAVRAQLGRGTAYSLATAVEIDLAELLCDRLVSVDQIRFCNSGTEAVMGAIKAARAFTGRPLIVKVEGSYHGTYDHAEASLDPDPGEWGSASAPATVAYAAGTPASLADEVAVIPFNDAEAARRVILAAGERCAGVLFDPMPSRVGMPAIEPGFIEAMQEAARAVGALVILDEVHRRRFSGWSCRRPSRCDGRVPIPRRNPSIGPIGGHLHRESGHDGGWPGMYGATRQLGVRLPGRNRRTVSQRPP